MKNDHLRVSVVIPAASESLLIGRAVDSVLSEEYGGEIEIIVVVNGANDDTALIAKAKGATVIEIDRAIGAGMARNIGTRTATGDLLVFLDADSYVGRGALRSVAKAARAKEGHECFGTVLGRPDSTRAIFRIFFALKNVVHRLGLYKGVLGGLLFADAALMKRIGGFSPDLFVDEHYDLSKRARRAGATYVLVTDAFAVTSVRRFEEAGMLRLFFFWTLVRLLSLGKRGAKMAERYALRTFSAKR